MDHSFHAWAVAGFSGAGALIGQAVQSPAVSLGTIVLALIGLASLGLREWFSFKRAELHTRNDAAELLAYRRIYGSLDARPVGPPK